MSLYAPELLHCGHCRYAGPPRPETLGHLRAAAQVLAQSELNGRQLSRSQRFALGSAWITNGLYLLLLSVLTLPFACTATMCTAIGDEIELWVVFTIGFVPLLIMLGSGAFGFWWIGRERERLETACAALPPRASGEPARCHVCGAPLTPPPGASVARCGFCSADNVVSLAVLDRMSKRQALVFDAYERAVRGHATSLRGTVRVAKMLLVLAALLAPIAGVGVALMIAIALVSKELPADPNLEYVAVNTEYGPCLALLRRAKDGSLTADFGATSMPEGVERYSAPAPSAERLHVGALIGRTVYDSYEGRVGKVKNANRTKLDEQTNWIRLDLDGRSRAQAVDGTCLFEGDPPRTLTRLETTVTRGSALAQRSSFLYVTSARALYRLPTSGGNFELVSDLGSSAHEVVPDEDAIFVATDAGIKRVAGDKLELIATGTALRQLAVRGEHVYYTDRGGVWRAPKAGGVHESLAASVSPDALAVDESHVYWLSASNRRVSRLAVTNDERGAPQAIATEEDVDPQAGLLVDRERVYWARKASGPAREIVAAPKTGSAAPGVIASAKLITGALRQGPDHLYFARAAGRGRPGAILELPKAGGAPRALGRGAVSPSSLIVAGDTAYWLDNAEQKLESARLR